MASDLVRQRIDSLCSTFRLLERYEEKRKGKQSSDGGSRKFCSSWIGSYFQGKTRLWDTEQLWYVPAHEHKRTKHEFVQTGDRKGDREELNTARGKYGHENGLKDHDPGLGRRLYGPL